MAKHRPAPIRGAATALAEARRASHEALVAELMAKRARDDAARAREEADAAQGAIIPLKERVNDLELSRILREYAWAEVLSRARWCAVGCYAVATGLFIAGYFVRTTGVVALVVASAALLALAEGMALSLWCAAADV